MKKFLEHNNMKSMSIVLRNYNGYGLRVLWEIKEKDYKSFREVIDEEIKKAKIEVLSSEKLEFNGILSSLFMQ